MVPTKTLYILNAEVVKICRVLLGTVTFILSPLRIPAIHDVGPEIRHFGSSLSILPIDILNVNGIP